MLDQYLKTELVERFNELIQDERYNPKGYEVDMGGIETDEEGQWLDLYVGMYYFYYRISKTPLKPKERWFYVITDDEVPAEDLEFLMYMREQTGNILTQLNLMVNKGLIQ